MMYRVLIFGTNRKIEISIYVIFYSSFDETSNYCECLKLKEEIKLYQFENALE